MKPNVSAVPILAAALLCAALAAFPVLAQPACITFEPPLALGTTYGAPVGQTPGTLASSRTGFRCASTISA